MLLIQRSHDINISGWFSLLIFVPFAFLVFWLAPGTQGDNRYGKPAPPNGASAILLATLVPLVMIIGMIAVPAYQDYVKRARAAAAQPVPVSAEPFAR